MKTDGTLVSFGFAGIAGMAVPAGLTNVTAVSVGESFSLALLPVTAPPADVAAPGPQFVPAGAVTQFSTTASGIGLSYRWQRLAAGASVWADLEAGPTYSDVASLTLNVSAFATMTGDQFRCVVSNRIE